MKATVLKSVVTSTRVGFASMVDSEGRALVIISIPKQDWLDMGQPDHLDIEITT